MAASQAVTPAFVTVDDVKEAKAVIEAKGEQASANKILQHLHHGSKHTILKHLRTLAVQPAVPAAEAPCPLSPVQCAALDLLTTGRSPKAAAAALGIPLRVLQVWMNMDVDFREERRQRAQRRFFQDLAEAAALKHAPIQRVRR